MRNEETWIKREHPKIIQTFSPRIQAVFNSKTYIDKPVLEIESCYLHGDSQKGKTIRACQILLEKQKQDWMKGTLQDNRFISYPYFLNTLRNNIREGQNLNSEFINGLSSCDFLLFDDFGLGKISDWILESIYLIINYRYEYMLPTVITSNFSLTRLSEVIGDDRIPERIRAFCKIINKKGYAK